MIEKIQQLIESKESKNNTLALVLLKKHLGLSFKEAFKMLKLTQNVSTKASLRNIYYIDILDFHISFKISNGVISGPDIYFTEFTRTVHKNGKELTKYFSNAKIEVSYFEEQKTDFELMLEHPILHIGLEEILY